MTAADTAVQIKLLILFTIGLVTMIVTITACIRHDRRIDYRSTLPLICVALFMLAGIATLALI